MKTKTAITTEGQTTTVEFAKTESGTIGISVKRNTIILQELIGEHGVGRNIKPQDCKELPTVILDFTKEESVDTLIKQLMEIKFNLKYPYGTLALAC